MDKFLDAHCSQLDLTETNDKITEYHDWLRLYKENPNLLSTELNKVDMDKLLNVLLRQPKKTQLVYGDSHQGIIGMLKSITKDFNDDAVKYNIINVDNHHDITYSDQSSLDDFGCANWGKHLHLHNKLNSFTWICNEYSLRYSRGDIPNFKTTMDMDYLYQFEKFDAMFISKSSRWIPPHLSSEIDLFIGVLGMYYDKVILTNEPLINHINNDINHIKKVIDEYIRILGEKR